MGCKVDGVNTNVTYHSDRGISEHRLTQQMACADNFSAFPKLSVRIYEFIQFLFTFIGIDWLDSEYWFQ